jgi:hypothetical protein
MPATLAWMKCAITPVAATILVTTADAAPPLPPQTIKTIASTLSGCSGGWYSNSRLLGAADLVPRLALLQRPSQELDFEAGEDLYSIAKGLLAAQTESTKGMLDSSPFLKCEAHPAEAVALFEYLAGEMPDDLRGPTNTLEWLGVAFETGLGGTKDPAKARRYFLRWRLHSGFPSENRWSDGIDNNLEANVARAGMRPYFDALAQSDQYGAQVRMMLAEAVLPNDPAKARRLLRNIDNRSLSRLLELEEAGRVPFVADQEDIAHWAKAARTLFGFDKLAARMLKGVNKFNGGTIPTSPERPKISTLRPFLDYGNISGDFGTNKPIPVRALVDPQGRPIFIEACLSNPPKGYLLPYARSALLDAARLYGVAKIDRLPNLPVTRIQGRRAYGWVLLPTVHFKLTPDKKQKIDLVAADPANCVYSATVDMPPPPVILPPSTATKPG